MEPAELFPNNVSAPALGEQGPGEFSFVDALVDPAGTFREPQDVARHPSLRDEEKRTILLSWARNEFVIEAAARSWPELAPRSRIEAVLAALALYDPLAAEEYRAGLDAIHGRVRGRRFKHSRKQ
jgi:hypothetical protein